MAKLMSHLKISGTLDDISFCQQQDNSVIVQTKTGPRSEQVKKSKRFANTRLYGDEFRIASRNGQLLRRSLGSLELALRCRKLNAHVIQRMRQMADTDLESPLGFRHANNGDISLLADFEFNHALPFDIAMPLRIEHAMDAQSGRSKLWVRSGIVRKKKALPEGATHYKIVSVLAAVDFYSNKYPHHIAESELLPLSKQMPELELQQHLAGQPEQVMLHAVGIVFYKVANGKEKRLKGAAVKVLEVVRVGQEVKEEGGKEGVQAGTQAVALELAVEVESVVEMVNVEELMNAAKVSVIEEPALAMEAPVLGMVSFVRAAEKRRCAECSVEGSWLVVDEATPTLPDLLQELVEEAVDGFELGIVDARGLATVHYLASLKPLRNTNHSPITFNKNDTTRKTIETLYPTGINT